MAQPSRIEEARRRLRRARFGVGAAAAAGFAALRLRRSRGPSGHQRRVAAPRRRHAADVVERRRRDERQLRVRLRVGLDRPVDRRRRRFRAEGRDHLPLDGVRGRALRRRRRRRCPRALRRARPALQPLSRELGAELAQRYSPGRCARLRGAWRRCLLQHSTPRAPPAAWSPRPSVAPFSPPATTATSPHCATTAAPVAPARRAVARDARRCVDGCCCAPSRSCST